jgi:UDP-N-acetyl-2-amino-2-deoxyglucuronate dehydrogenase
MATGFGIVGCGMIAAFHVKAIADIRGAKVVACFDNFPDSAKRFAKQNGCTAYDKLSDMLADPDVDVVTICTPSGAHMEPAVAAANAGKHVVVEKPLEITLKRCDKIIEACKKNNVVLSPIFPSRFHGPALEMKRAIDKGRFGTITVGDAYVKWFRTQAYYDSGAWRGTWKLDGGGALMNQAIHSVDLLVWMMGPVASITAHTATLAHTDIEVEDVAVATLRFENGALGVIEASTAIHPGFLKRIEIHGSHGTAVMEEEDIKSWEFAKPIKRDAEILKALAGKTKSGGGASDPSAIGHHGHTAQFKDVLKAIKKGTQPAIDGPEGRKAVEVILAIYKAAETGRAVQLPLKSDPVLKARQAGRK